MGRVLTACALLMAIVLGAFSWFDPESFIMWFAATEGQLVVVRWVTAGLLAALLVADTYADIPLIRRLAAVISLMMAYDAARILVDQSVYMFDFLIVALTAVCFAIVALQPQSEQRPLPALPKQKPAALEPHITAPAYVTVATVFDRLQQLPVRQRGRNFFRAAYISDIKDDSHRLMVGL